LLVIDRQVHLGLEQLEEQLEESQHYCDGLWSFVKLAESVDGVGGDRIRCFDQFVLELQSIFFRLIDHFKVALQSRYQQRVKFLGTCHIDLLVI
jgi:hypothetical protein